MPVYRFYRCGSIVVMATSRKEAEVLAEHILKRHVVCRKLKGVPYEVARRFITGRTIMAWAEESKEVKKRG